MSRVLVIGYGNPLRGDDGLGPSAARALGAALPEAVTVETHQLTPELAQALSRCDLSIFIDADAAAQAGEVRVERLSPSVSEPAAYTHHVSPATLLRFAEVLYGSAPEAYLVTAGVESLEFNETLTSSARRSVEKIVQIVCDLAVARDNGI